SHHYVEKIFLGEILTELNTEVSLTSQSSTYNLGSHNIYDNTGFQTFTTAVKINFPKAVVTKDANHNVSININDTTETLVSLTLSYEGTTQAIPFTACSSTPLVAPPAPSANNDDNVWQNVTLTKEDFELGLM